MSGSFSFGFTQGVKLRVFFKDHQDTGCEDDSGALPDAKAVQASSVLVQLRSLKFTCFDTNLHQSSLTRKWSFWDLGRTPEAAHTSALSSMTSASNKQKRSRSCKRYFYGEISNINEMLTSSAKSRLWVVSSPSVTMTSIVANWAHVRLLWRKLLEWTFSLDLSVLRVCISRIKDQYFYIWCQLHFPCSWNIALGQ